ncbi:AAA family ATPase [Psychrobacillus psychrodurans]|uniref:AAA family ATPase n=1 Tax=Psychrobacillus psychrodurans TaxID=126157 RepID=UPI003D01EBAB
MINKIFLESLTLKGFRKNYEIKFKEGLNFISGPLSTGKSSIAEMINYALGSENHKSYIEIRQSCKDVELVIFIGKKKFRIIRPLFDFNRPVKLFEWNNELDAFNEEFILLEIDISSNKKSLSYFLLNELGLPNIKVVNQDFSFRDLFKYCYVSQSNIDSENLLMEKTYGPNLKRKPTFEIIFSIYDELLGELRQQLKEKNLEISSLMKKQEGIYEFLKDFKLLERDRYYIEKQHLGKMVEDKSAELAGLKEKGTYNNDYTLQLEDLIHHLKDKIIEINTKITEKKKYIDKLSLLRNQYVSDLQKIEFIIEGAVILNSVDFEICPSCLNEIAQKNGCGLCGSEFQDLSDEETKAFKSELKRIKIKSNSLLGFIEKQQNQLVALEKEKEDIILQLKDMQREIEHLRKQYISPYVEQIGKLNYEIGILINNIDQLEKDLNLINQFDKIKDNISIENSNLKDIIKRIEEIEGDNITKEGIIQNLSKLFEDILKKFSFPKLSDAYIKEKDYLPYVRNIKYDQLGSGGAVTMTTMAYFLSIALLKSKNKNHPGILIIDSPRKNLGADAKVVDEFKDEAIFNSIIKYFISIFKESKNEEVEEVDRIQLIVINNGDPEYLNKDDVIVKFDGDGTKGLPYGLIDDTESVDGDF